jgi:purine-binding chemotaxis protein CheW
LPKPFSVAMASRRQQSGKKSDPPLVADAPVTAETDSASAELLIFRLAGESFGLTLAGVAEIVRLPNLVRMPLVPPSLLGLANLRGIVLPVVSLRALLRLADIEANESTRVIVMRGDAPVGFVVDRVDRLLTLAANQIEKDDSGAGTIDPALLDGVVKGGEGESPIKVLSPSRLLNGQFVRLGLDATSPASPAPLAMSASAGPPGRALVSLLSFYLNQQEYALPLDRVREIIPLPDHIAELPRPETAVLGVVTLRDRLLPLVSLRALLGLPIDDLSKQRGKVVVMSIGEAVIGLAVDATREILRLDPGTVEPAPALLTRGEGDAEIVSICRLDDGRRLVALLSPDRLFRSDLVRRIMDGQIAGESGMQAEVNAMADEQFIIFRLGHQDYGIPIAAVGEIARPPERLTRLPKSPEFIDGVMNLRGSVVPIVDLRRRFDLGAAEQAGSRRILMLAIGGVIAGFIVDSVSEILKVTPDAICPAPELSPEQMRLISRVINLEEASGRLILLVDPAQLLDQVEADLLAQLSHSEFDAPATAS